MILLKNKRFQFYYNKEKAVNLIIKTVVQVVRKEKQKHFLTKFNIKIFDIKIFPSAKDNPKITQKNADKPNN